jgi:5-methylthioadenosine/S-adenosylhomocysteine deaminase
LTFRNAGESDLLVRNGYVMTMDPYFGDLPGADVRISGGLITAIGVDLAVSSATHVVDATDMVVLPGLIDTHRHVWQGAIGGAAGPVTLLGYFLDVMAGLAPRYTPEDVYAGTLWGALQALNAGITTMVEWSHITTTPDHTDADIKALNDSRIRAIFLHGPPVATGLADWFVDSELTHPEDARRVRSEYFSGGSYGRLTMGLALRGPDFSTREVTAYDFRLARELDLPLSIHAGGAGYAKKYHTVKTLEELKLLGPDVNYAHANMFTDDDYRAISGQGGSVSSCPTVEMLLGIGTYPAAGQALEHGVPVGLGGDTVAVVQTDLFAEMRMMLTAERSRVGAAVIAKDMGLQEVKLDHRDMLRLATIGGAEAWHLDTQVGSLRIGKQADVIVVDTRQPHLTPLNDPVNTVVLNAGPSDVDTVIVAGEIVKSGGVLVGSLAGRARDLAVTSSERILAREAS